ncbi:MAG TPA: hypothetical protein VK929_06705 [Longimicrobiales bacterium]|nr:hypothetical protein [Longimicrobiales bacterium]
MLSNEDRPGSEGSVAAAPERMIIMPGAGRSLSRFTFSTRTAPRGSDSRIGDDETHRRLQEARNRARHDMETLIRRELGPEWARD